jgi:Putative DNA-binding domain
MTQPVAAEAWDLERIRQTVSQGDLERGRTEYKREVGNGRKTLEAIAALANTFGGAILVGVDEERTGLDRLVGVEANERDRLARMCWDQLVPPIAPEIIPIKLDQSNRYVLAVIVNPDYLRRPVMLTQGNKVLVRIEGHNVPADWYRLRDLFAEQPSSTQETGLQSPDPSYSIRQGAFSSFDLAMRGRLLLSGPRGGMRHISEAARAAVLDTLNNHDSALTHSGALSQFMHTISQRGWDSRDWTLGGPADTQKFSAQWQGLGPNGRPMTEARIHVRLIRRSGQGDALFVELTALLTNPRNPGDLPSGRQSDDTSTYMPVPFVGLDAIRQLMLDVLGTLWGPPAETLATGILGQPLRPPAQLDLVIFAVPILNDSQIPPLNECIDFGPARLIPGNTPGMWTRLGPIQLDREFLTAQSK